MIPDSIQFRLTAIFAVLITLTLLVSGLLLFWTTRQGMEKELGRKLEAVASAASVHFSGQEIDLLFSSPGTRTRTRMRQSLEQLRAATGVKRIYFFSFDHVCLLDTDTLTGSRLMHLQLYMPEIAAVRRGESSYSPLFTEADGTPSMTGFSPLRIEQAVRGGVGVTGSVPFLESIRTLQVRLYGIGIGGVLLGAFLAFLTGRSISRPIVRLAERSRLIGGGDYSEPVRIYGRGEPAVLARTMEIMRRNILQRENDLKAMVAGVAHEIRNPLGGISLFTGLLRESLTAGGGGSLAHLDRIGYEIDHLREITDHFLEFARPRPPEFRLCPLGAAVNECLELMEERIRENGIRISASCQEEAVCADPHHLKQIILNLLQNAVQAMPRGGDLAISCSRNAGHIRVLISDTGHGVPAARQKEIFEPFFTTREKGTGLGLSIVKNLMRQNRGDIRLVKSSVDGTLFELLFAIPNPDGGC
ncbi:HAMP domain-containing protein [bacterium]|nr:HAMP domain-containing protein [bacterium]